MTLFEAEHDDFRQSFRTFLEREVKPAYPDWRDQRGIPRELLGVAGEHGFLGMSVPEEQGGVGVDDPRFGVVIGEEAMRAGAPALALLLTTHNDVALPAILRGAPAQWRAEKLAGLASGERIATVLGAELGGQNGKLTGEAELVVNGTGADAFVVATEGGLALVERDAAGVSVEPSDPAVGLDAAGFATVRLDGAEATPLEGAPGAVEIDQSLSLAVTALAGARAALAVTTEYVKERKAFGQPIAAFQNTRRMLAQIEAEIEVADAFVERCVRSLTGGGLEPKQAATAKLFCTELYGRAVDAGVQLHGGYGYIMEYEIAHAYADARYWRLAGQTSQRARDAIAQTIFDG